MQKEKDTESSNVIFSKDCKYKHVQQEEYPESLKRLNSDQKHMISRRNKWMRYLEIHVAKQVFD